MKPKKPRLPKVGERVCYDLGNRFWGLVIERVDKLEGLDPKLPSTKLKRRAMRYPYSYKISPDISPSNVFEVRHVGNLWFDGDNPGFGRAILRDPK